MTSMLFTESIRYRLSAAFAGYPTAKSSAATPASSRSWRRSSAQLREAFGAAVARVQASAWLR